jgi:hypothetical protein
MCPLRHNPSMREVSNIRRAGCLVLSFPLAGPLAWTLSSWTHLSVISIGRRVGLSSWSEREDLGKSQCAVKGCCEEWTKQQAVPRVPCPRVYAITHHC